MPTSTATNTLDELVATARAAVAQSIESANRKQENAAKGAAISNEIASTLNVVAGDVAVVTATRQAADLKVQAENARIARAAGIDPEVGANILVDTVAKLRQSNAEAETALKTYRAKNESSFLDNPINWVVDQITLPIAEARLEGAVKQSALYSDQLTKVNNTLQESFQTTEKLKESISTASAAAATRVAAAQSLTEAKKFELEALKYNNMGIEAAQNATAEQLGFLYNTMNAQKAEQQLKLAQESGTLARERFDFEKTMRQEALDAKKEGKVLDDAILAKINTGRAASGMLPLEGAEAQFALAKMKSGAGGDVQTYYEIGDKVVSTGRVSFGNTPADATKTLTTTITNLPDIKKETAAVLSAALSELQKSKTVDRKDPAASAAFVNKFVNEQIGAQYSNIVAGSGNLFDVGDLSSYLTLSGIKDLPVTQKVLAPMAATGVKLDNPKVVLGLAQKAMKDGTLTTSQLADISTIYRKANLVNQAARDFQAFGIVLPNNGKNYFAKVSTFGKPLDLTDPTAIQRHLSEEIARGFTNRIMDASLDAPTLR